MLTTIQVSQRRERARRRPVSPVLAAGLLLLPIAACGGNPKFSPDDRGAAASAPRSQPATMPNKEAPMTGPQLAERVKNRDWNIVERNEPVPPQAVKDLTPLLRSPEEEVRELTTHVLNLAGGAEARDALLLALQDRNEVVRGNAARFLHNHCTAEQLPILLGHLRKHPDDYVREQMALLLGKLKDNNAVKPLQEQFAAEDYPDAKHAMALALVRLGDEEQTKAYVTRLEKDDARERVAALDDLLYIQDRKLAPHVIPLLSDRRDGKNVGPSHGPFWIRVCDVAVNVLSEVLNKPFGFQVSGAKRYAPPEIENAIVILRKLPK